MRYAGFWRRVTAYGIDASIVQVIAFVAIWLLGSVAHAQELSPDDVNTLVNLGWLPAPQPGQSIPDILAASGVNSSLDLPGLTDFFIMTMISGIYNIWFTAGPWQATLGKHWCKMIVINSDGSPLSLGKSALRWFASGVSWLPFGLGYLMVAFSYQKTAMHDAICGTRVVYRDTR